MLCGSVDGRGVEGRMDLYLCVYVYIYTSQMAESLCCSPETLTTLFVNSLVIKKNLPANAGDSGYVGLIPGSGRAPEVGNGNPLQYSCLENPMEKGTWRTTVHWTAKSRTQLSTAQYPQYKIKSCGFFCFVLFCFLKRRCEK